MSTRKLCIIGDFAVGKTSLVARFVHSLFSEQYLTTVGVKIDTKLVTLATGEALKLVIWDVAGTDRFSAIEYAYMRGSTGYLLVADGTRPKTLHTAAGLRREVEDRYGVLPHVVLVNKRDLQDEWATEEEDVNRLGEGAGGVFVTSARSGQNVEEAILSLAEAVGGPVSNDRGGN